MAPNTNLINKTKQNKKGQCVKTWNVAFQIVTWIRFFLLWLLKSYESWRREHNVNSNIAWCSMKPGILEDKLTTALQTLLGKIACIELSSKAHSEHSKTSTFQGAYQTVLWKCKCGRNVVMEWGVCSITCILICRDRSFYKEVFITSKWLR